MSFSIKFKYQKHANPIAVERKYDGDLLAGGGGPRRIGDPETVTRVGMIKNM